MALIKMSMQAYADAQFTQKAGAAYSVFLNPESFVHKSENSYETPHPPGSAGDTPRFNYASQGNLDFSLLLDGTRAIDGNQIEVSHEIAALKSLAFAYHGQIRSPYYVQVTWGSFLFQGRLTTFNVTYTLFRPDGMPVRAKVDLAFVSFTDNQTLALLADNQQGDLMRQHVVQAGDTLPQLSQAMYGDAKHYLQVAQHNGLVHFRKLVTGMVLKFPPLHR
jgi:Contractile injection system tube protein